MIFSRGIATGIPLAVRRVEMRMILKLLGSLLPRMPKILFFALILVLTLGCRSEVSERGGRPTYVVTIPPLRMIVEELVGERGEVICLLAPGSSPHTYDPSTADARAVERATLFISVHESLDGWAARLPAPSSVQVMELIPSGFHMVGLCTEDHDHGHHHHGDTDGHFWTDPRVVAQLINPLVDLMSAVDPEGAAVYRANGNAFREQLDFVDEEMATILAPHAGNPVLLMHPSFLYLLHRYGLRYIASVEESPGKEITPRQIDSLVSKIQAEKVAAVFSEPQLSSRPAQVIAEAAGLPVRLLDPLGGVPERDDYRSLMLYNARTLAEALSANASP